MYKSLLYEPQLVHSPVDGRLRLEEGAFQIGLMVLLAVAPISIAVAGFQRVSLR